MASAPFRIIRFYTRYVSRGGQLVPVDMVEYCAIGKAQNQATPAPISMLSRVREDGDASNPAWAMAKMRWDYIKPQYEAWKTGQVMPEHGTPLAAWSGLTQEQAEVLRQTGLRTLEELAEASDAIINRVQLPSIRDIQAQAKAFLSNRDRSVIVADLAAKDREMAELRSQLEEMKQLLLAREPELADDGREAPPRRRGRPPKVTAVEAETAA